MHHQVFQFSYTRITLSHYGNACKPTKLCALTKPDSPSTVQDAQWMSCLSAGKIFAAPVPYPENSQMNIDLCGLLHPQKDRQVKSQKTSVKNSSVLLFRGCWFHRLLLDDFLFCGEDFVVYTWPENLYPDRNKRLQPSINSIWLVVLEHEFYHFPYIGNSNPNWGTHIFQMGWNHQPAMCGAVGPLVFFSEKIQIVWFQST